MKKVYLLPNLFTTASLLFGILAILETLQGDFERCCWYVLIASVLDALDGKIARLTKTESGFGLNYDSLADLIVFGVAPGLLIYSSFFESNARVATGVTILYIICCALRLARFNVQVSNVEKQSFSGLPTPAAAGTIVTFFLAFPVTTHPYLMNFLLIMVPVLSYLMVSKVPYPSFKNVEIEKRKPFDYLVSIIIIICGIFIFRGFKEIILFTAFMVYVLLGIRTLIKKRRKAGAFSSEGKRFSVKKHPFRRHENE